MGLREKRRRESKREEAEEVAALINMMNCHFANVDGFIKCAVNKQLNISFIHAWK